MYPVSFQDGGHPEKLFKLGQAVRGKVVEVISKPQRFVLSLTGQRSSFMSCRLHTSRAVSYQCCSFHSPGVHKLEKGSITLGMVTNVHPQVGLQVKLPFGGSGTVAITELADAYRPNPLDGYSKGQLIRSVGGAATFGCQDFFNMYRTQAD